VFRENISKITKNPLARKALGLFGAQRFLGPAGAGILAYDAAKYMFDEDQFKRSLSPEELAQWKDKYEPMDPMAAAHGYAGQKKREGWDEEDKFLRDRFAAQEVERMQQLAETQDDRRVGIARLALNRKNGGITTLDPLKPWALPPESGPDPRGQKIKEGIEYLVK
jgi:hypothetical protein